MELFLMCLSILTGAFAGAIFAHWRSYRLNVGSIMTVGAIGSWTITGLSNMMLDHMAQQSVVSIPVTIVCSVSGAVLASLLFALFAHALISDDGSL